MSMTFSFVIASKSSHLTEMKEKSFFDSFHMAHWKSFFQLKQIKVNQRHMSIEQFFLFNGYSNRRLKQWSCHHIFEQTKTNSIDILDPLQICQTQSSSYSINDSIGVGVFFLQLFSLFCLSFDDI